jgi:hypothetical protein
LQFIFYESRLSAVRVILLLPICKQLLYPSGLGVCAEIVSQQKQILSALVQGEFVRQQGQQIGHWDPPPPSLQF